MDYLKENKIIVTNTILKNDKISIVDEVNTLIEFQKRIRGYNNNIFPRLECSIGKSLERMKITVRDLQDDLEGRERKINSNEMDEYILKNGRILLERTKELLNSIKYDEYLHLIRRSMRNYELCIGKSDSTNLMIKNNEFLYIGTTKNLSYNLIEHDLYNLIRKRKGTVSTYKNVIERFIYELDLDEKSYDYIRILCSIPIDELKIWNKYRKAKEKNDYSKHLESIKRIREYRRHNE